MRSKRILFFQSIILAISFVAVGELTVHFPYPSPLIKPLLRAQLRWPTEQIKTWVELGNFGSDFLEFFARDPERMVPAGRNVVSPADGIIKDIIAQGGITYFIVGLSFWDVHVVRTPMAGVVKSVTQEGLSIFKDSSETSDQVYLQGKAGPVQQIVTLDTDDGEIKVRLITSYWASRLKVWVHEGQRLEKGQRIGRILLGSSVVAEFRGGVEFSVKQGQRIVGGETIISNGQASQ